MAAVNGSPRNDVLNGTPGNDQIFGFEGDDRIDGRAGNDLLDGGLGNDVLSGGSGGDILMGGPGNNILYGSSDAASNGAAGLSASDPDGDDVFFAGPGNNVMWGGIAALGATSTGNDVFHLGGGTDAAAGGDGIDTAVFALPRDSYTIAEVSLGFPTATGTQVPGFLVERTDGATVVQDRLVEVENLRFLDGRIVRDPNDTTAGLVRLYQAALDRAPDPEGLSHWAARIASGVPFGRVAALIADSPEFRARFGATDGTGYVQQLYRNVLGREGEPSGVAYWVDRLNGGVARADVLVEFSQSAENRARTNALVQQGIWERDESVDRLARLYTAALDRAPDPEGLASWKAALDGGATIEQVAQAFTATPEFLALHGGPNGTAAALVDALYRDALGREPDPAGRTYWAERIESGAQSRAQVLLGFAESAENKARTNALDQRSIWDRDGDVSRIARLYETVFDRSPEPGGLTSCRDALDGGAPLQQIADAITATPEFLTLYGGPNGTASLVDGLYRNAPDREPDSAGRDHWIQQIESGAQSRAQVLLGFSESLEHRITAAPGVEISTRAA